MDSSVALVAYILALAAAVGASFAGLTVVVIVCAVVAWMLMFRYELLWIHQRAKARAKPQPKRV